MPIPLIFPVVAALGLAVASSDKEAPLPRWEIDIDTDAFQTVDWSSPGYIEIDLEDRSVRGWTATTARPPYPGTIRFQVDRINGDDARAFFETPSIIEQMEAIRSASCDDHGEFNLHHPHSNLLIERLREEFQQESYDFGKWVDAEELMTLLSQRTSSTERFVALVTRGHEPLLELMDSGDLFDDHGVDIDDEIVKFIKEFIEDELHWNYEDVDVDFIMNDDPQVEVRDLLELPAYGLRVSITEYTDEDEEDIYDAFSAFEGYAAKHPDNFEWVGKQSDGTSAWNLWLPIKE